MAYGDRPERDNRRPGGRKGRKKGLQLLRR